MFINLHGPPTRDPAIRAAVNLHLSKVSKNKRTRYNVEKLDRRQAQQRRRRREIEEQRVRDETEQRALVSWTVNQSIRNSMSGDLLTPEQHLNENTTGWKAARDFFTVFIPYEGNALGLSVQQTNAYARGLLSWAYQHDAVMFGLASYRLCCLPSSQDPSSHVRQMIEWLRSKVLNWINNRLAQSHVDDVLIQVIILAMVVDDYLGYVEFRQVHLQGLDAVIDRRGGLDAIGTSEPAIGRTLRQSTLTVIGTTILNINTSLRAASKPSPLSPSILTYPEYSLSEQLHRLVARLPIGLQELALSQHLSVEMVGIVLSFTDWLNNLDPVVAESSASWRHPTPAGLSNLEKCLYVALICLSDDLSGMGGHISVLIFRKPGQRARMILSDEGLWDDPRTADCVLWLATVVCSPRNITIIPRGVQNVLQEKILRQRPEVGDLAAIERILRRFFYPEARAGAWMQAWAAKLAKTRAK